MIYKNGKMKIVEDSLRSGYNKRLSKQGKKDTEGQKNDRNQKRVQRKTPEEEKKGQRSI